MADVGLLCAGSVRFGFLAADNTTIVGSFDSKNTVSLKYDPGAPDLKNRLSKNFTNYGSILDQVAIPKPNKLDFSFDTIDADGLATVLRGSKSGLTITGATVAPATFNATTLDQWIQFGAANQRFFSAITVTNTGATTTYVLGTDYVVDVKTGNIKFLPSGAITLNQALKLGYTYASYSGSIISAETQSQLFINVQFQGKNLANGAYIEVNIPKYACAPNGGIDFMAEDFAVAALTGSAISVNGAAPLTAVYAIAPAGF
jgi:hypothetical protein